MPTTATATSAQTARQRDSTEMRRAVPEGKGGGGDVSTQRAQDTTTRTTAAAPAQQEKGRPEETAQSRASDLRSRRGIEQRARSELRCAIDHPYRIVGLAVTVAVLQCNNSAERHQGNGRSTPSMSPSSSSSPVVIGVLVVVLVLAVVLVVVLVVLLVVLVS